MGSVLEGSSMGSMWESSGKVQIRSTYINILIGVDVTTVQSYLSTRSTNVEATPLPNQDTRKVLEGSSMGSMWDVSGKVQTASTYHAAGILVHIAIGHSDSCTVLD